MYLLLRDEVFVFFTTFVELQKLLKAKEHSNMTNDDQSVIEQAVKKNDLLIQFFFKTLYAADKKQFIRVKDLKQKDLEMARDTFEYLTMLLPFL